MISALGRLARPLRAGMAKTAGHDPRLATTRALEVTSPAFADGSPIPLRHLGFGEDVSPPLAWSAVPGCAVELVLIVEDPDAPLPRPIVHALASGIDPHWRDLAEGALNAESTTPCNGIAAFGRRGYLGPKPVPGHGVHRYVFQLFAVDAPSRLGDRSDRAAAIDAMAGHVVAAGTLTGTCRRD